MNKCDVAVIGAGPGGYPCAIRLGQLKKNVLVIESGEIGGVCLNRGCIPTKALSFVAEIIDNIQKAQKLGLKIENGGVDLELLRCHTEGIVKRLRAGIEYLFKSNGVNYKKAKARIISENKIELESNGTIEQIDAENIVIATGTEIIALPGFEFDGKYITNTDDALKLNDVPNRLLVVGAGACGLELANIYACLGSKVMVVEIMEQILPGMETELCENLSRILKKKGIEILLKSTVQGYKIINNKIQVEVKTPEKIETEEYDRILITVGRKPTDFAFKELNPSRDKKGYIIVDEFYRTSIKNIFAIGDIIGPPLLAHKATKQGIEVAEIIAGIHNTNKKYAIPSCVFTIPPLSSIGLTEKEAIEKGYKIKIGKFPYRASGKALSMLETEGLVKIVAEDNGKILGVHILGAESPSLIGEAILAIEKELKVSDLAEIIHPHPTLTETIGEAAENFYKKAIHIVN
uniref:Dihydrolipoyl dehydrogenase n=1 Tax=candidate division WOR-3 bacterium TaxID=2052148 RepID=A0A7V0Z3H4_UNCW3